MTKSYYDDEGNFIIESEHGHKITINHLLFERYSYKNIKITLPLDNKSPYRLGIESCDTCNGNDYDIVTIKGYGAEYCD